MFKNFCRPLPTASMIAIIVAIMAAVSSGHHASEKAHTPVSAASAAHSN